MRRMRHGEVSGDIDQATFLGDDPALALVTASMDDWLAAHPCECDALCACDQDDDRA